MGKGVKSLQFKARVLKSEALKQCRTRVLYRLYHCSVQRQGVMEHDCSHSAMTAQASTSSITAKRGRITPLAAESQWCGLSMLILIRVARPDPTDGFANLHRYVQLPADISSPLFWRTGVSFLPLSARRATHPLLQSSPLLFSVFSR